MKFFWQNRPKPLNKEPEIPSGTFRCDICGFVQPSMAICGSAIDQQENPPRIYTLCGSCALWLGMGASHFTPGLNIGISAKQHAKINALKDELEKCGGFERAISQITAPCNSTDKANNSTITEQVNFTETHVLLDNVPVLKSLIKFRYSMLSTEFLELATRLTRGEKVSSKEIKQANL